MSELPGEGADFFGRIPLFREFARLLAGPSGPVNWELARQVAIATALGADTFGAPALPSTSPPPDPAWGRTWDDRLRLAELWVDPATTLAGGMAVTVRPTTRADWAEAVLPSFAPLVEPTARKLGQALGAGEGAPPEMAELTGRLGSLLTGAQVGAAVGQLARTALGTFELALPVPPADRGRITVIGDNVRELERTAGVPADQLGLWLACQAVVHQRLFAGVGWLGDYLHGLVADVARHIDPDAAGLVSRLQGLDLGQLDKVQDLLEGDEEGLFGPPSAALQAATARLEGLLSIADGYTRTICARALAGRLPALGAIQGVMGRRAADEEGSRALFIGLLRADPDRAGIARGERFCHEVLAATGIDSLDRLWAHPDFLPSPQELDVPGRWLERTGVVGGTEIDLDEGLRALLEGDEARGDEARGDRPAGGGRPAGGEPAGGEAEGGQPRPRPDEEPPAP